MVVLICYLQYPADVKAFELLYFCIAFSASADSDIDPDVSIEGMKQGAASDCESSVPSASSRSPPPERQPAPERPRRHYRCCLKHKDDGISQLGGKEQQYGGPSSREVSFKLTLKFSMHAIRTDRLSY